MQLTDQLSCKISDINQDYPHQVWESLAAIEPNSLPLWMVSLVINKYHVYLRNLSQCYFHYWGPNFWMEWLGVFLGLAIWILAIAGLLRFKWKYKRWLILVILVWPVYWMWWS